ncbi:MAG: esterase family protein, partial [Terracidiphilus sp.]
MKLWKNRIGFAILSALMTSIAVAGSAQSTTSTPGTSAPAAHAAPPAHPGAPVRDPHTPGYVKAKQLPDGENAPPNKDGNFILGPTHPAAPEATAHDGVPKGKVYEFTMSSADSKFYPGIAREKGTYVTGDPDNPAKAVVSSHPAPYTRHVGVYVPQQYVPGTEAPFLVTADGIDGLFFTVLDNLIAEKRVP